METHQTVIENSRESEAQASKVKMDDLPYDVIVIILSFLSANELAEVTPNVCTKWRIASQDPIVWLNKEYLLHSRLPDAEVMTTLRRVPQLRCFRMYRPAKGAVLHALSDNCPHLSSLELADDQWTGCKLLKKLVINCRNLQKLIIPNQILLDKRKASILAQLRHLQSLEVVENLYTDEPIHLGPLGDGCPELSKLTVEGRDHLLTEDLKQFIEGKCRTLTHLELPWTDSNERSVVPLLKNCTALVNLILYDDYNKIGELLRDSTVLSSLSNLHKLSLYFYDEKNIVDVHAFKSGSLPHLQVLKISGIYIQRSILVAVCECCPNLKELYLKSCNWLDDGDLKELHRLKKLETLGLTSCGYLNGEALVHVAQMPTLRNLLLNHNNLSLLIPGLFCILDMCSLEMLSLSHTSDACYFPFSSIPEKLINLRVLKVEGCKLEQRILDNLKNQMPRLKIFEGFKGRY